MAITYAACDQTDLEYILDSFMQNDAPAPSGIYNRFKILLDEVAEQQRQLERHGNTYPASPYATWAARVPDLEVEVTDKDWASCPF